jgi:hypothetical protein
MTAPGAPVLASATMTHALLTLEGSRRRASSTDSIVASIASAPSSAGITTATCRISDTSAPSRLYLSLCTVTSPPETTPMSPAVCQRREPPSDERSDPHEVGSLIAAGGASRAMSEAPSMRSARSSGRVGGEVGVSPRWRRRGRPRGSRRCCGRCLPGPPSRPDRVRRSPAGVERRVSTWSSTRRRCRRRRPR